MGGTRRPGGLVRWLRARRVRWLAAGALAAAAALVPAGSVLADCGNVAVAQLAGDWQLQITVQPLTGLNGGFGGPAAGTQGTLAVHFTPTCTAPGSCSVAFGLPGDPNGQIVEPATGFYGGFGNILTEAGAGFTTSIPTGGIGGVNLPPCRPPAGLFTTQFQLTVIAATGSSATGWVASVVTGTASTGSGWTCNGSTGVAAGQRHWSVVGVPAGRPFPASLPLPCAVAAISTPVPAAQTPARSGPVVGPVVGTSVLRSTLASTLTAPGDAFPSLPSALVNALITLAVILFITFPAHLFNHTFEENYEEIRGMVERRLRPLAGIRRRVRHLGSSRLRRNGLFALVVLAGSLLGGLNDPGFGVNRHSVATYLAVVLAVLWGVTVSALVAVLYRRARRKSTARELKAIPAGLLIALACVVVSRTSAFQPGYLYGVICGVAFGAKLAKSEEGHTVALSAVTTLVLGVGAWLLWVPVNDAASAPDAAFLTVLADNFLASIFIGGLVGSVVGLLPLRFLPGGTLADWNRKAWAATFGIAVFFLVQVMLRPQSAGAHAGNAPIVTAILLFLVFGGSSVAFSLYFSRRHKRRKAAPAKA